MFQGLLPEADVNWCGVGAGTVFGSGSDVGTVCRQRNQRVTCAAASPNDSAATPAPAASASTVQNDLDNVAKGCVSSVDASDSGLLHLPVVVGSLISYALIDSGATHSFVSQQFVERVGFAPKECSQLNITLADGSVVSSFKSVSFPLALVCEDQRQGKWLGPEFRLVDHLHSELILGMDWLRQVNPKVDWVTGKVVFPSGHVVQASKPFSSNSKASSAASIDVCSWQSFKKTLASVGGTAWLGFVKVPNSTGILAQSSAIVSESLDGKQQGKGSVDAYALLCSEFEDVFGEPGLPPYREVNHSIELKDPAKPPPKPRQYRLSQFEQMEVKKQVAQLLEKGWIRPSVSPYGSPVLFVRKKTGELRMCIDFRLLNQNTKQDVFPLPRIADLLTKLSRAQFFTSIDLSNAYHQVRIEKGDEYKTAFLTNEGLYEFVVMPFGLCNAPATFQRIMNMSFADMINEFVLIYLDDLLVFSESFEEHLGHLRQVLQRLRDKRLFAKRQKCRFGERSVRYLGHVIEKGVIAVDPAKCEAVRTWPVPTTVKELQQFIGLANYYNEYIKGFAQVASPLTDLLSPKSEWIWNEKCQDAFEQLRKALCSSPVLRLPDPSKDFVIECDASGDAVGAVLLQEWNDGLHPVAYFSKKYAPAERNYAAHDKELLAVFKACMRWRCFIDGRNTVVYTDHKPLVYLKTQPMLSKRQTRWLERLEELSLEIRYKAGPLNVVADTLSRRPGATMVELYLDDASAARVSAYLKAKAPQFSVEVCVKSLVEALKGGALIQPLVCPKCSSAVLSNESGCNHECNTCGHKWSGVTCVSNPLTVFNPQLKGNRLLLQSETSGTQGKLNSLVLEPGWLGKVYEGQIDSNDHEMARVRRFAQGQNSEFVIRESHGFELVYRQPKVGVLQLVIPKGNGLRQLLLSELHNSWYATHLGVRKTVHALQQRVWWPKLPLHVKQYVNGCEVCQRTKDVNAKSAGLLQPLPIPSDKFEQYTMDFVTDLPLVSGYNGLFVVVDKFSKYTKLIPVRLGEGALSAEAVAQLFFEHIVKCFGVPKSVLHDRDPRFTSTFWQTLWKLMGTKVVFSSAYHPQTDGQTERQNRTVQQLIRCLVHEGVSDWVKSLSIVELSLNNAVQDSTGLTPFMITYGRSVAMPIDHVDGMVGNASAEDQVKIFRDIHQKVCRALTRAQGLQKRYADQRRRELEFAVGDQVLLSTRHLRLKGSRKLADRYVGPFQVVKKVGPTAYKLDLSKSQGLRNIHDVFHVSLLRTFSSNGIRARSTPVQLEDEDQEWELQGIKAHRTVRGIDQYLVSFVGFDDSEDCWMSGDQLPHAQEMVQEYRTQHGLS